MPEEKQRKRRIRVEKLAASFSPPSPRSASALIFSSFASNLLSSNFLIPL